MHTTDPISRSLAQHNLDLNSPADFLLALHFAQHWPRMAPLESEQWTRQLELIERVHPIIFDRAAGSTAVEAVWTLFLGGDEITAAVPSLHASSFTVFRAAFEQGLINGIAYGAALRCVLCLAKGSATPWLKADSTEGRRELAAAMTAASPMGLMRADERRTWRALPERLTIYRGGCSGLPTRREALIDGYQGIYWTRNAETARYYLASRSERRCNDGSAGWPFMVAAEVDREAICGLGRFGDLEELFVDFNKIDPGTVRCALPSELLAA